MLDIGIPKKPNYADIVSFWNVFRNVLYRFHNLFVGFLVRSANIFLIICYRD